MDHIMRLLILPLMLAGVAWTAAVPAHAKDQITVTIRNHRFEPTEVKVPAGKRVIIYVDNKDATPEEFESHSLKVEKVIPGKTRGIVRIGPLAKGRYDFFGDFHQSTAQGVVVAE
jgi:plastocyanin